MTNYEMMLLLVPDWDHNNEKKNKEIVAKILPESVTITDISFWGKRELAYQIRKFDEGVYLLVHFQAEGLLVSDVQGKAKLMDDILRFLITQQTESKKVKKVEKKSATKKQKDEE